MDHVTRFRFSNRSIETLPPCPTGRKAVEFSDLDCPGLKLAVTRTGAKVFWFRFVLRAVGKPGTKGAIRLGSYPALSLIAARKLALAHRTRVEQGIDVRLPPEDDDDADGEMTFARFASEIYLPYSRQHKRSHADDRSKLNCWLLDRFGQTRLKDFKRRMIEGYLDDLRQTHSPASVNRHLTLLSALFRRAIAIDLLDRNPCTGIARLQEAGPRQQSLTPEQAARLLHALEQDRNTTAAAALALMLYSGTRKQECLRGRWADVDLGNRVWLLPMTKSGRSRFVQLSDVAVALLESLPSRPTGGWLFPGRDPAKPLADPRKVLKRALVVAGLPLALCPHGLRHAHASIMVGSGRRTLVEAQMALGHASSRTTLAYLHLSSESARDAVQSVADAIGQARLTQAAGREAG